MEEEHWLLRRFVALPWYVKGPAIPAGFLVSAFNSQFPPNLQLLGYYCGLALALWVILASIWHWTNDWSKRNCRVCFVSGIAVFIIAGWHLLETPPTLPSASTQVENDLREKSLRYAHNWKILSDEIYADVANMNLQMSVPNLPYNFQSLPKDEQARVWHDATGKTIESMEIGINRMSRLYDPRIQKAHG
jgi:hypothetical protein